MNPTLGVVAVLLVVVATLSVGAYGWRFSRTTSDFFVASRSVRPALNASAIGGEYLSAASFLGVAGLVLAFGTDMLWYPVGWTAGYLVLLVLVAAPLRRSGAYTLPDFAEARLESRFVRHLSSALVVLIGWFYLVPQFQGASFTLGLLTGAPGWVGAFIVMVVVMLAVAAGGMRSITLVQAVQYWIKLTALAVPAGMILAAWWVTNGPAPEVSDAWALPLTGRSPDEHHLYRTFSLIVAAAIAAAGCGGGDETTSTVTAPTATAPASSTTTSSTTTTAPTTTSTTQSTTTAPTSTTTTHSTTTSGADPTKPDTKHNDTKGDPSTPEGSFDQYCEDNPGACG